MLVIVHRTLNYLTIFNVNINEKFEIKNNLTVTRGYVGGDDRGKGEKGFQEQV